MRGQGRSLPPVQPGDVNPRGSDTKGVRLPPVVEVGEFDADRRQRRLDVLQSGLHKKFSQLPLPSTGQLRFTMRIRVEILHCAPEQRNRAGAAGVVPYRPRPIHRPW